VKVWADEDFKHTVVEQLNKLLSIKIERVQDMSLTSTHDTIILEEAAKAGAILLTHDKRTLIGYAYDRVEAGLPMPGVIAVKQTASIGTILHDLEMLLGAGDPSDFENKVIYVPYQWE
jgi:hypothetical protein